MTMHPAAAGFRRVFPRHVAAGGEQADPRAREVERRDVDHRDVFAAEFHAFTERTVAREREQLGDREVPFLEHADHGVAHEAGGPEDRHSMTFRRISCLSHD